MSRVRLLLISLIWPLCGFSCVAFREFQVRPYLSDLAPSAVTLPGLVSDYRKVSLAIGSWAKEQGLEARPCQYYDFRSDYQQGDVVTGISPACQVFRGDTYSVHTTFTPSTNSTAVSVSSPTHAIAESKARALQQYLAATFGAKSLSGYGGGEKSDKSMEQTR